MEERTNYMYEHKQKCLRWRAASVAVALGSYTDPELASWEGPGYKANPELNPIMVKEELSPLTSPSPENKSSLEGWQPGGMRLLTNTLEYLGFPQRLLRGGRRGQRWVMPKTALGAAFAASSSSVRVCVGAVGGVVIVSRCRVQKGCGYSEQVQGAERVWL